MDDRIDLSPLDPSADRERWEALVGSIATRAVAARRHSPVLLQLVAWSRPALAVAAGLALAICGVSAVAGPDETGVEADPAYALSSLADADELPSASRLLQILGGDHGDL